MTMRWRIAIGGLAVVASACGGSSSGPPGASADGGPGDGATAIDAGPGGDARLPVDAGPRTDGAIDARPRSDAAMLDAPFQPRYGYQVIDAPSPRARLVFDDDRQKLYAVNRLDEQIERFAFSGGAWSALAPVVIGQLKDVVMTRDRGSLVVFTAIEVAEISLTGAFEPEHRADILGTFCNAVFDHAAAAANGKMFAVTTCSSFPTAYFYDVANRTLTPTIQIDHAVAGASADGTRIYIGGDSFETTWIYNGLTGSLSSASVGFDIRAISVSDNASRVIVENAHVYSRSLTFLGNLQAGGVALASHDSHRAFVYREDAPGPRIDIYDLDAELESGNLYPVLGTVRIPDAPNGAEGAHPPIVMASTPDDTVVFVSGDRRLLVVPLDAM